MESHQILNFFCCAYASTKVVVAEWLRRWTWNPLGSPNGLHWVRILPTTVLLFLISLDVMVTVLHTTKEESKISICY